MSPDIFEDPSDTREEILAATYRSLATYGYADLSIGKIGEEFPKSQSLIYHHYDNKEDLTIACLEFLLDHLEREFTRFEGDSAREELEQMLDWAVGAAEDDGSERFLATLFELRARSPHNEAFREQFRRTDRIFEEYTAHVIRTGIEGDEFRECDPERVAKFVQTFITGASFRRATTDSVDTLSPLREEMQWYLTRRVFKG